MRSRNRFLRGLLPAILCCLGLFSPGAHGESLIKTAHLTAQLIHQSPGQSPFHAGILFNIKPEWHLYWQNPGDSGEPPQIEWQLPAGISASAILWPTPHKLPLGPLMNFGYEGQLLLPVRLNFAKGFDRNKPINLIAKARWLVCKEECVPEQGEFHLTLSPSAKEPRWDARFEKALAQIPSQSPWPVSARPGSTGLQIQIDQIGLKPPQIADLWFFPARYGALAHAEHQNWRIENNTLFIELSPGDIPLEPGDDLAGVLWLSSGSNQVGANQAFQIKTPIQNALPPKAKKSFESKNLLLILGSALLGGLILNLMPCVFPVLSLKALQLANSAQEDKAQTRRQGLSFTAGVLASFAAIAGVLLALRSAGTDIGWGFQLQEPVFVLLLIWLFFALGLMLSGVLNLCSSLMGLGEKFTRGNGLFASFATGVLAVLVASPCTAPFMGTALGFAINQPAHIAISVFLALGLGLALPWLVLAFWPALHRLLPKPGAWMEKVKEFLAFPLYATAIWLLWVLVNQIGSLAVALALSGILLMMFALWLSKQHQSARLNQATAAITLLALAGVAYAVVQPEAEAEITWQRYSEDHLQKATEQNQPVLVNFTADWCISCLVNERVALNRQAVVQTLAAKNVLTLKGDWTKRDAQISQILQRFKRSGVPLYLLYPPGSANPKVLPQILTEALVLENLATL